jgi:hypothetical protein
LAARARNSLLDVLAGVGEGGQNGTAGLLTLARPGLLPVGRSARAGGRKEPALHFSGPRRSSSAPARRERLGARPGAGAFTAAELGEICVPPENARLHPPFLYAWSGLLLHDALTAAAREE